MNGGEEAWGGAAWVRFRCACGYIWETLVRPGAKREAVCPKCDTVNGEAER